MKILLLGDCNSIHIIKWVKALHAKNFKIGLFSLSNPNHLHFDELDNFSFQGITLNEDLIKSGEGNLRKLNYLKSIPKLRRFIKEFQPDILHAHYASSYGLIGTLTKFHPFIVSVWGSDIYDFPRRNLIFKELIKNTLQKADLILSTSKVMAKETNKYTNKIVYETPFGVDIERFKPSTNLSKDKDVFTIGTIKALDYKYGIDVLIDAFAKLVALNPQQKLKLQLVGDGKDKSKLKDQVGKLGLNAKVNFLGKVDNSEVPNLLNTFDLYAALSRWDSESFGVAIVEAQACEIPVVVSNKGGLPEVVAHDESGLVVASENPEEAARAIQRILEDKALGIKMGKAGRLRVKKHYNWENNVDTLIEIYTTLLS